MTIAVLGAGAFGTALAISLGGRGPVTLVARDPEAASKMQAERSNARRLPGATFPERLSVSADTRSLSEAEVVLIAVPMQKMRDALSVCAESIAGKPLVACCKGIELTTLAGPASILREHTRSSLSAVLTGPSFAADIARGLPTALTLACSDRDQGAILQEHLRTDNLRIYRTDDVTGAELGGALKNVIAIGCGTVMGAGLGESARAALMTRGYAEMTRFAVALGAKAETLSGLSGFGDLTLTCTSEQSRNYRLGLSIGKGMPFDGSITVEGATTARAIARKAEELGVDMPISKAVAALLDGKVNLTDVIATLLSRPLREE